MTLTDFRYRMLAVTREQLRESTFMRGLKDCLRREVSDDQHTYPIASGGRLRFSRRKLDHHLWALVAEWPAQREVADPIPQPAGQAGHPWDR